MVLILDIIAVSITFINFLEVKVPFLFLMTLISFLILNYYFLNIIVPVNFHIFRLSENHNWKTTTIMDYTNITVNYCMYPNCNCTTLHICLIQRMY